MNTPKPSKELLAALEAAFKQHGTPGFGYEIAIKPAPLPPSSPSASGKRMADVGAEALDAQSLQIRCYPDGKGGIKCL